MTDRERDDSIDQIDQAIRKYLTIEALRSEADTVACLDREFETRAEVDRKEGQRLIARAKAWERFQELLRFRLIVTMQEAGVKRIEGVHNTLSLRNCAPSCDVRQPELVPDQYKRVEVKMPYAIWQKLMGALGVTSSKFGQALYQELLDCKAEPEVMRSLILPDLKQGPVAGCALVTDKQTLQIK
jgi:hypothetical protein